MCPKQEKNLYFGLKYMLFLNISSDQVHLLDDQSEQFLERNGIENTLGPTLLQYTQQHPVETIFLLNGPGGFTNLRVGTLTLNMLNTLLEHDTGTFIPIASISKFDLYGYAMDWFSWMMINCFAVGLMWMVLFAAIKANALGKAIGEPVQKFGQEFFQTLPIVQLPGMNKSVGIGTLAKGFLDAPERKIEDIKRKDNDRVSKWYNESLGIGDNTGGTGGGAAITHETAKTIVSGLSTAANTAAAHEVLAKEGHTPETLRNNSPTIYAALNEMEKNKTGAKEDAMKGIKLADQIAYENILKLDAVTNLEKFILIPSKDTNQKDIEKLIEDNKKIVDDYFKAGHTEYTKTIDNVTFTITKDPADATKYVVNKK